MNSHLLGAVCVYLFISFVSAGAHSAPVIIDPLTGLSGRFNFVWPPGTLQTSPADGWEVTVGDNSLIDILVNDNSVIGDEFAFVFDGGVVPWDSSNPGAGVLFFGQKDGLFLSAGIHTFDFQLTAGCCMGGGADYSFSAVSLASGAYIPIPPAFYLFGSSLIGLVGIAKQRM